MENILIEVMGWTGSVLYLLAYALVSSKKLTGDSLVYQGLNIFAGILLVIYGFSKSASATVGLNATWIAIGVITLARKWTAK